MSGGLYGLEALGTRLRLFYLRIPIREEMTMTRSTAATVLTVDDDPIVRADLRLVLEDAGFDVCGDARDGIEAVELARTHRPDVIVLDLALPRLDGVEVTRQILGERDVPIVALTGYGSTAGGIAERAVEAGATSVVQKPFADHAVVGAVNDALAAHTTRVRERSRETLAELVGLLGYPEEWASTLESQAYAAGKIWFRAR
jgi:CheY-like chemotaxis protein